MCGRFSLFSSERILKALLGLASLPPLSPRYNIAPSQPIFVVRIDPISGEREPSMLRWGLIPAWAKEASVGAKMINARCETVFEKPAFRQAARKRRCLIPASGFIEWKKVGNRKQPFFISNRDGEPMVFAGVWEKWEGESPEATTIESCAILTTDALGDMQNIHERTPVILRPDEMDLWLSGEGASIDCLKNQLTPYDGELRIQAIGKRVNNARIDDPSLLEPEPQLDLF